MYNVCIKTNKTQKGKKKMARPKGRTAIKVTVSMTTDTKARLLQYAFENHILGGVSGAISHLIWNVKVKNAEVPGQLDFNFGEKK